MQPAIDYLAKAAGLRDPRDFNRPLSDQQFRRAQRAVTGIMVRAKLGALEQPLFHLARRLRGAAVYACSLRKHVRTACAHMSPCRSARVDPLVQPACL